MKKLENNFMNGSTKELNVIEQELSSYSTLFKTYLEELKNSEEREAEYYLSLKELMFMVSHKIRHSISNILGLLAIYEYAKSDELQNILLLVKESAELLDLYTKEISNFIDQQKVNVQERKNLYKERSLLFSGNL